MARVGVIGIGHGVFGRRSDATVQELAFEAFRAAIGDAGIDRERIDADLVGDGLYLAQVFVHLVAGRVDGAERRAGQFKLPARLQRNICAVLFQPDDVAAFEDRRPAVAVAQTFEHRPDPAVAHPRIAAYAEAHHIDYPLLLDPGCGVMPALGVGACATLHTAQLDPDDADALRIMQRELYRAGVGNHYFFCGRDIVGHKNFNVPIEEAWHCLNESQKGLSGVEAHARLSITHYKGKTEVAAVTNDPLPGAPHTENGFVVFKLLRSAASAPDRGKVCIVGRNPEAIWFSGYDDRVVYDELGLYHDPDELRLQVIGDKIKRAG